MVEQEAVEVLEGFQARIVRALSLGKNTRSFRKERETAAGDEQERDELFHDLPSAVVQVCNQVEAEASVQRGAPPPVLVGLVAGLQIGGMAFFETGLAPG